MAKVVLKHTNNLKFAYLEGTQGELSIMDNGRFEFAFVDPNGNIQILSSTVIGRLGDLNDVRSKDVSLNTKNSSYDFEKLENYLDETRLFSNMYDRKSEELVKVGKGLFTLGEFRQFAENQATRGDFGDVVSFVYEGVAISNPFVDETARFEVNPFLYYGQKNMDNFIALAEVRIAKAKGLDSFIESLDNGRNEVTSGREVRDFGDR